MMDEYFAVPISPTNKRARAQMDALLEREGIERDRNLTYSAAIYDDDGQMIATGSLFENTLRCLAVDGAHLPPGDKRGLFPDAVLRALYLLRDCKLLRRPERAYESLLRDRTQ